MAPPTIPWFPEKSVALATLFFRVRRGASYGSFAQVSGCTGLVFVVIGEIWKLPASRAEVGQQMDRCRELCENYAIWTGVAHHCSAIQR